MELTAAQPVRRAWEQRVLLVLAAMLALLAAGAALKLRHAHFINERGTYGVQHLAGALGLTAAFALGCALLFPALVRWCRQDEHIEQPARPVIAVVLLFTAFWLPLTWASGFVADDWMLLLAAQARAHALAPAQVWHTLDAVDGNFRPLSTDVVFALLYRMGGLHSLPFRATCFAVNLLDVLLLFALTRRLTGHVRAAAFAAALFLSRGLLFTIVGWASALSDALAILFGLLALLCLLGMERHRPGARVVLFALATLLFIAACLSKQSAFALPVVAALMLLLRWGRQRAGVLLAAATLLLWSSLATVMFLHGRILFGGRTPYPLSVSVRTLPGLFSYVCWYVVPLALRGSGVVAFWLPVLVGVVLVAAMIAAVRRVWRTERARSGEVQEGGPSRTGLLLFASGAAAANLLLLFPLGSRMAPYYGANVALWLSVLLGVLADAWLQGGDVQRARRVCFAGVLLVLAGYAEVRVKQTALMPAGGYIWGTFGMDIQRQEAAQLAAAVQAQHPRTVVLVDPPYLSAHQASMVLLLRPEVDRVLVLDRTTNTWLANDLEGRRADGSWPRLNDRDAYNWETPLTAERARQLTKADTIWIPYERYQVLPPTRQPLD